MTIEEANQLKELIDKLTELGLEVESDTAEPAPEPETNKVLNEIVEFEESIEETPPRELPKDKRVVRTKASGDRVYLLDEVKETRSWVTNPQVLDGLGFTMEDVTEVADAEMLKYAMSAALYRLPDAEN